MAQIGYFASEPLIQKKKLTILKKMLLQQLQQKVDLDIQQAEACLNSLLTEETSPKQCKAILEALIEKGETEDEILGFSKALLSKSIQVPHHQKTVLEVCGTGGSGQDRFNISTAVAFLCASIGISVAKHGNLGSQKANGSFDFLQALNINIHNSPEEAAQQLDEKKLCFLFARAYHPVLKKLGPIRKEIGKRSILNLIGPLCNPAHPTHQVLGCTNIKTAHCLANALIQLGRQHVMVVVGEEGCDEVSFFKQTTIIEKTRISEKKYKINAKEYGITPQKYAVGLAKNNADLFIEVIKNAQANHPLAKHISFSAALPFYMMGKTKSIQEGYHLALNQIKEKKVYQTVQDYQKVHK